MGVSQLCFLEGGGASLWLSHPHISPKGGPEEGSDLMAI